MDQVCEIATRIARYDLSVLVLGESGSGKELLARAIHYASPRAPRAFVMENCAAMSETLLESELFGHKRGSFTGAYEDHVGLFQRADGGTVFLDEIGDTSQGFQVKLLRVLQEGEVRPVGATRAIPVNVRVIAATHRNLEDDVRAGRFRQDLYYRLAGMTLSMPPLRERSGDTPLIADALLQQASRELGKPATRFTPGAVAAMMAYPWPGNIRELRNEIYRALALTDGGEVDAHAFSSKVLQGQPGTTTLNGRHTPGHAGIPQPGTLQERLDASWRASANSAPSWSARRSPRRSMRLAMARDATWPTAPMRSTTARCCSRAACGMGSRIWRCRSTCPRSRKMPTAPGSPTRAGRAIRSRG